MSDNELVRVCKWCSKPIPEDIDKGLQWVARKHRLMAAAPQLLWALREITDRFERICTRADGKIDPADVNSINNARAAIAMTGQEVCAKQEAV